jgi:imidazolonepropionase-like amidohydrolase
MNKFLIGTFLSILPFLISAQTILIIKEVSIVDVEKGKLVHNQCVTILGNKIISISEKTPRIQNARIINGRGKFLIPGLWDMHVHLFNNISRPGTDNHEAYFPLMIANGVTGVRDMWTDPEDLKMVREWKQQFSLHKLIAPRIAPGSSIVDGVPTFLPNMLGVANPEQARSAVNMLKNAGAGFIKVYWNLTPESYQAIAGECKKLKIDFAGHVPFSMSAADVSRAGQKSIEHLTGIAESCSAREEELRAEKNSPAKLDAIIQSYDEDKCTGLFRLFAKNKTWQVPTLVLHQGRFLGDQPNVIKPEIMQYAGKEFDQWVESWKKPTNRPPLEKRKERFEPGLRSIKQMHELSVPILAGTDLGNPFIIAGFSLHDELELFVKGGLTPLEALQTATINASRFLNTTDSLGSIKKGKLADLVLLDENPLVDINNTRKIFAVIMNGQVLERKELDELLKQAREVVSKQN